jgi:hypothetical protein
MTLAWAEVPDRVDVLRSGREVPDESIGRGGRHACGREQPEHHDHRVNGSLEPSETHFSSPHRDRDTTVAGRTERGALEPRDGPDHYTGPELSRPHPRHPPDQAWPRGSD